MTVRVERLGADDARIGAVADLVRAAFEGLRRRHGVDSPSRHLDAAGVAARLARGACHVALADGRVVGCVFTRPSRDVPGALYLGALATAPAARGRGVAAALVAAAAAEARAGGSDRLALDTFDGPGGAADYFARLGFERHAAAEGVVAMVRAL